MQVSSSSVNVGFTNNTTNSTKVFTQKLSQDEVASLKAEIEQNSKAFMSNSTNVQSSLSKGGFDAEYQEFQSFLSDIGYSGKPIAELSQEEAAELVSEDGFFGIDATSQRVADFVIQGSGGDEELMREGRRGVIEGYEQAVAAWGGELPEISQKTQERTLELIDKAMMEMGYSILDEEA